MQPEHPGRPTALFRLTPPYTRFEELPDLDASEMADLPLGSVLVIELAGPNDWPAVEAVAPRLRARFPAAPLALRIRSGVGVDPVEAAHRAAPCWATTRPRGKPCRWSSRTRPVSPTSWKTGSRCGAWIHRLRSGTSFWT